ncbi:hypothetical protein KXQ82_00485 [Mucilaginibacter sp. HMF5004]|uniref:hypothetical protein n=1 Tax=Mucilaginibacter rivuli TaxID=2857527 RepID=UPI001C5E09AA|nr:hypothetical protein [Mucilaginibacter rivuli]MBW4888163.1 hypothetical protein [Mucilaginibacter rivuli]
MKKLLLLLLFTYACQSVFAQSAIYDTMEKVESHMKYLVKKYNPEIFKTDTSLAYSFSDSTLDTYLMFFKFDKNKKCDLRKWVYRADIGLKKSFKEILGYKNYDWRPINSNKFLSKFSEHLLLVRDDESLTLTITPISYTETEYQKMLNLR